MPAGTAQGIAVHKEYKGASACLVEIDCRPQTVNRKIRDAYTGPRVTKVDLRRRRRAADQPARRQGPDDGRDDGRHRAGAHLRPAPQERPLPRGQLGRRRSTRASGTCRREVEVIVMPRDDRRARAAPASSASATTMAAVACAYGRATGQDADDVPDQPRRAAAASSRYPTVPPIPPSPTDGLERTACGRPAGRGAAEPMPNHTFILNGKRVTRRRRGRRPPALGAARRPRRHRPEVRLRHRRLPGLHVPHQRQGVQPVLRCRSRDIKPTDRDHDDRGPGRRRSARTCTRCRRRGSTSTSRSAATASRARS